MLAKKHNKSFKHPFRYGFTANVQSFDKKNFQFKYFINERRSYYHLFRIILKSLKQLSQKSLQKPIILYRSLPAFSFFLADHSYNRIVRRDISAGMLIHRAQIVAAQCSTFDFCSGYRVTSSMHIVLTLSNDPIG